MAKQTTSTAVKHDTPRTIFDEWADEGAAERAKALPAELTIVLRPHGWPCVEYTGTAKLLAEEGLIPDSVKWPVPGSGLRATWQQGAIKYSLMRARPPGAKGGAAVGRMHDWFVLRMDWDDGGDPRYDYLRAKQFALQRKSDELAKLQSMEGQMERHRVLCRLYRAQEDQKFRAFLSSMVPEQKKPGRKAGAKGADHG